MDGSNRDISRAATVRERSGPSDDRFLTVAALALLGAFLAVSLATAKFSPVVWTDEALFADPAWHLATGQGFTSTMWPQPKGTFYAMNVPLYFFLLAGWIKLFGLSPLAVRSLNMVLVTLAAGLVWRAVRVGEIVRSPRLALLMLAVLLCSAEITTIARNSRYDALCAFGCALIFNGAISRSQYTRMIVAILIGMMLPLAGLQTVFYCATLGGIVVIFWPRFLRFVLCLGAGIALGLSALIVLLRLNNALGRFLSVLRKVKVLHASPFSLRTPIDFAAAHPTLAIGVCILIVLSIAAWKRGALRWRSPEVFGIVCAVVIPTVLMIFYHFRGEYGWMIAAPILISIIASIERVPKAFAWRLAVAGLLAIALVGAPLILAGGFVRAEGRDYSRVERFVAHNLNANDRVAIDPAAYYPARLLATDCVSVYHLPSMTAEEKSAITVLVAAPSNRSGFTEQLEGDWTEIASLPPIAPARLAWLRYPGDKDVYALTVYRRKLGPN